MNILRNEFSCLDYFRRHIMLWGAGKPEAAISSISEYLGASTKAENDNAARQLALQEHQLQLEERKMTLKEEQLKMEQMKMEQQHCGLNH